MTSQQNKIENQGNLKRVSRRKFLGLMAAGISIACGGPVFYASAIEPNTIEINHLTIPLPGLAPDLHGLRLVQLSDLHAGMWLGRDHLVRVAQRALDLAPDLILITGDFMTAGGDDEQAAGDLNAALKLLTGAVPVMAVRGNHDHGPRESALSAVFAQTGILELANTIQSVDRGGGSLYIAGIDSVSTGHQGLHQVVQTAPSGAPIILLAHEPDMADYSAPTGKFAFQISGHSHGGQVRLPLLGRVILPWMARKYPAGLYQIGGMILYTNRGIGTIHMPFRLNCPPEITVFTLAPA